MGFRCCRLAWTDFPADVGGSTVQEEAQTAIQELNGTELGSRQIEVREDNKTVPNVGGAGAAASGGAPNNSSVPVTTA